MTNLPRRPDLLIDGLHFPEGPRWRGDRLWFSDILGREVVSVDMSGRRESTVKMDDLPSGLGWLPDGRMLVVSTGRRKLLRVDLSPDPDAVALTEIADLATPAGTGVNDMVVDAEGRAYIGAGGGGLDETKIPGPGNMPRFGYVLLVTPDGTMRIAADRMTFPNGPCITPDGRTLIFAETFGFRLTAFDIKLDGTLWNRRVWADLGVPTDGICLDQEGCVWVAVPYFQYGGPGGYVRIAEGGEVRDRIDVEGYAAYACTLGGPEMRTLFMCESAVLGLPRHPGDGRIRVVEVDVPGTGSP